MGTSTSGFVFYALDLTDSYTDRLIQTRHHPKYWHMVHFISLGQPSHVKPWLISCLRLLPRRLNQIHCSLFITGVCISQYFTSVSCMICINIFIYNNIFTCHTYAPLTIQIIVMFILICSISSVCHHSSRKSWNFGSWVWTLHTHFVCTWKLTVCSSVSKRVLLSTAAQLLVIS